MKFGFAAIAAIGLTLVTTVDPYGGMVTQAQAFVVVPFSVDDKISSQKLAVGDLEAETVSLDAFGVELAPEPEPVVEEAADEKTGAGRSSPVSSGAPAAGTPDPGTAQAIAMEYVGAGAEFDCLVALWNKESHWNVYANNASSGAYGIPQALPGSKMASAGADWATNPDTQIRWGLGYITGRYGSPCGAWGHSQSVGWY
ncbi:hypothetical protein GCM10022198_18910 [Klugiella xanthotipulae]|uniref:Transglycosylase-like protein with SLT domain n=1 Tax=Klugiella xanthotipulae TaxID=244735 RepID=A0A543HRX6_9MICO|nr:lytic transglycosylase domain-containing protein [Klugiella xanthotipulae]TQM61090.1 hypothetical protein FB466_2019 [Klugiella xanthotipulae]